MWKIYHLFIDWSNFVKMAYIFLKVFKLLQTQLNKNITIQFRVPLIQQSNTKWN